MRLRSHPPALIQNPALPSYSPLAIGHWLFAILASCLVCLVAAQTRASSPSPAAPLSPAALTVVPDGTRLFIACATANQVAVFDVASGAVTRRITVPHSPSGVALSSDGSRLYVTCAAPHSSVRVLDTGSGKTLATFHAGHTAMAPVLSPDGKTLFE